jgi:hypothetical protein
METMPADLKFRHRLFTGYAIALAMGILLPWRFGGDLLGLFLSATVRTKLFVAESVGILLLLAFIPPSLYLVHHGRKTLREGRYPNSGMKVIYDTRIQRGSKAKRKGHTLSALGVACITLVLLGSAATHFIFYKFKTDPLYVQRNW